MNFVSSSSVSDSARCAACRYFRRRCTEDCVLAPYFPASEQKKFSVAHKVFGAGNITRMLQQLPVDERADAAESIHMESVYRDQDPVYGTAGVVYHLDQQVRCLQVQLAQVKAQITMQAFAAAAAKVQPTRDDHIRRDENAAKLHDDRLEDEQSDEHNLQWQQYLV